ncbi:GDSL esterase/lipase EXL3-like protein [Tanacetum coccineum]
MPAYLDPSLDDNELLTGVSFASGGTGYDPETPKIASVLSFADQLNQFKEYIMKVNGMVGEETTQYILANSIFLVVASSNDVANTYFTIGIQRLHCDISSYADLMESGASNFIQDIHKLGARRIGVFSAPPLGCPSREILRPVEVVDKGCCGTGEIEVAVLCNKYSPTCDDDSKYLFWDSFHPTNKGYSILIDQILGKYVNDFF